MGKLLEKLLSVCVAAAFIGLAAFNILLHTDYSQAVLGGGSNTSHSESELFRQEYLIKLSVSDENAVLMVNGEAAAKSKDDKGYSLLTMCPGDVASLDLRDMGDKSVTVFVAHTDEGVSEPAIGTKMIMKGGIRTLFTLKCQ
ncbi:MAG: hypothetical protein GX061_00835 [Eubacteriaceae bacterium]|nr:hypothetical protein [Eubacteriaceae bacterium]